MSKGKSGVVADFIGWENGEIVWKWSWRRGLFNGNVTKWLNYNPWFLRLGLKGKVVIVGYGFQTQRKHIRQNLRISG